MRKKLFILFLCLTFCLPVMAEDNVEKTIYDVSSMDNIADSSNQISSVVPDFSFAELTELIQSGENIFAPKKIFSKFLNVFFNKVYVNIHIMLIVIVLSIIWGIISNIQSSYNSKAVSETAFFAFYSVFLGLIVNGMNNSLSIASEVISDQVLFMKSAVPVYTALIMSTGNVSSAAGMEPVFLYFVQLIGSLLEKFILPLVFWISILNMINCITEKFSIKKLIEFVKQVITWGMGILMTFFVGILGMAGFTTSVTDSLGLKTLKFAVGNFVPVVGGLLSDSVSTVLASTTVLKSALGTAGVITIILMCAMPLIEMLALILIYKLTAGVIEPMCDKRITAMVSEAGSAITYIFLILLTVTVMFILGITIVIGISNKFIA